MLIITSNPFSLIKYHVKNENSSVINIIYTSDIKDITDALIQSVVYTKQGDLITPFFIIKYEGNKSFKDFNHSKNTLVYLVVENIKLWSHFDNKKYINKVKFLDINPSQYKYVIDGIEAILEPSAVSYFWSEYCIKRFNSNPSKWYNEVRFLLCKYTEHKKKFTCTDLDFIYNKVSDIAKEYIKYAYTNKSKEYIKQMTDSELFTIFVGPIGRKSLFFYSIEKYKPEFLNTYMVFKEAVMSAKIRVREAVYILDYLINEETNKTIIEISNLFNLK